MHELYERFLDFEKTGIKIPGGSGGFDIGNLGGSSHSLDVTPNRSSLVGKFPTANFGGSRDNQKMMKEMSEQMQNMKEKQDRIQKYSIVA